MTQVAAAQSLERPAGRPPDARAAVQLAERHVLAAALQQRVVPVRVRAQQLQQRRRPAVLEERGAGSAACSRNRSALSVTKSNRECRHQHQLMLSAPLLS